MRIDGELRRLPALGLLITLLLLSGCDNTGDVNPVQNASPETFQAEILEAPTMWVLGSNTYRSLSVRLDISSSIRDAILVGEQSAPVVWVRITPPSQTSEIDVQLLDDGGYTTPTSTDGILASTSGDLVPNDFTYTIRLNSGFASSEGEYVFAFLAAIPENGDTTYDDLEMTNNSLVLDFDATVAINSPPQLDGGGSILPDSLRSGFESQVWSLLATDPDVHGGDYITSASLSVMRNDAVLRSLILTQGGGNDWTLFADSSFNAGISTGDVVFRFTATDRYEETSSPLDTTVWIENTAPVLDNPVAPDTVFIPAAGEDANTYELYVHVSDKQGSGDMNQVYYTAEDPQGTVYTSDTYVFADNGILPDEFADDGVWSTGISVQSGNENVGTWIFRFYGADRAGNVSDPVTVPIVMEHTP